MEDEESLESSALISQFPDSVQAEIDDLFSDGVVSTSVVVGGILLASDELFRMEQLVVGSSPHFIDNGGFQVEEDSTGNVFSGSSLAEEGVESVITTSDGLVRRHLAIRLDTMLKTVEFPAGITDLTSGLSKVDRDALTLKIGAIYLRI